MFPFMVALTVAAAVAAPAHIRQLEFSTPDGMVRYGLAVPDNCHAAAPCPLVLALHPGGNAVYYGASFMRSIVIPALTDLNAIVVAPDCPARSWADPRADASVTALVEHLLETYAVDRKRIMVMGFSMGGRGSWFFASHHADLFTAAIPMASSVGDEPLERLASMPIYVIHSRDDQVVPFAPMERTTKQLADAGRVIRFEALSGIGHYEMGGYVEALRRAGRWVNERWSRNR